MDIESIVMLVISSVVGIAIWYFKRNEDRLDSKDKTLQGDIDSVKRDLSDYKLEAQREFVTKDEFVRAISNQDKKLDKIYEELIKINVRKEGSNGN